MAPGISPGGDRPTTRRRLRRQWRADHGGGSRGIRADRPPAAAAVVGDWDIATNPPPSIGGPDARRDALGVGSPRTHRWADIIEVQQAVLTYRSTVHDYSPDLEDGYLMLETVREAGLKGPLDVPVDRTRQRRRQRRARLRHHGIERILFRRNGSRHGVAAQQLPRRARAQPARTAPSHPAPGSPRIWPRRSARSAGGDVLTDQQPRGRPGSRPH